MNKKSLKITTGAAVVAIFTLMMLINRQTGAFFEEILLYVYPIPMVAFAAQYGWKSSLPVLAAMTFFSFLFGNFTSIFYSVSQALIGLVLGACLYRKTEPFKTLFSVMSLSAISNLLNMVILADLFGINIKQEITAVQDMMQSVFAQAGVAVPASLLSESYLMQMWIACLILVSILQGFIIYTISLLILRRLRFQVQKPKSVFLFYPPRWTGWVAVVGFSIYYGSMLRPFANPTVQNVIQSVGIFGKLFLSLFGFLAVLYYIRTRKPQFRRFGVVIGLLLFMFFPVLLMFAGYLYVSTDFHEKVEKSVDN